MKEFKNVRIEIVNDCYAENPRTFCERLTTIYSNHRGYSPDDRSIAEFDDGNGDVDWGRLDQDFIYLKIRAYIHSGISISTSCGYPYNDRWDSGLFGIIAISKADARKEFGPLRATTIQKIEELMEAEVKELNCWYTGDTYGYRIRRNSDDEEIESVWNYYGEDHCVEEAEHAAEYWDKYYDTKAAV